jgi:hypothetical protein
MRLTAFRARPVAVLAFAALLLGANLEPAVGMVREGEMHHETVPDGARVASVAAPVAGPSVALGRAPASSVDGCGSAGDHCAHVHGYSLPAHAAPVLVTGGRASVVLRSDAAESIPLDRSVRPPIR